MPLVVCSMGSSDSEETPCNNTSSSSARGRVACNCSTCLRNEVLRHCRLAQTHSAQAIQGLTEFARRSDRKKVKKKVKKEKKAKDLAKNMDKKDKDEKGGNGGGDIGGVTS